jgi:CheY-like chemotaxis protein
MSDTTAPSILVVEDEFLIRMMLVETLADEGFRVIEAGATDEALDLLRDHASVSLMITDLTLPGTMDGLELARQVRNLRAELPIIYVTGRPDGIDPGLLQPHDRVIAKPYLPSQIAEAARAILRLVV